MPRDFAKSKAFKVGKPNMKLVRFFGGGGRSNIYRRKTNLEVKHKKIYLTIENGKIMGIKPEYYYSLSRVGGKIVLYDFVEGFLRSIVKKQREFQDGSLPYWYIDLDNGSGDIYSLCLFYNSEEAKTILNSLAAIDVLGKIRIDTSVENESVKIQVYNSGEKLSGKYSMLPPIEILQLRRGRAVKDETNNVRFFEQIAENIMNKVNG